MIAVDTNVVVRLLVDDASAPDQCRIARERVAAGGQVLISHIALAETVWVLHRSYRLAKGRIVEAVRAVLSHPHYRVDDRDLFLEALGVFQSANIEFADAVMLCRARGAGCALKTFDRALGKLQGAELLA